MYLIATATELREKLSRTGITVFYIFPSDFCELNRRLDCDVCDLFAQTAEELRASPDIDFYEIDAAKVRAGSTSEDLEFFADHDLELDRACVVIMNNQKVVVTINESGLPQLQDVVKATLGAI
ncbi:hypothetical protein JNK13_04775 [bacterium]|nr:hypothetical protein [bacterium]